MVPASATTLDRPRVAAKRASPLALARPRVRAVPALLVAIVVAHLALRLGLVWRFPPFWDELGYGEWARSVAHDPSQRFVALNEGKEPLTSWLGALWVWGGVGYLTAVRLVSVVASLVSLAVIGVLGRRLGATVALVSMALYAGLPIFVIHDSLGLMEPTVTAMALLVLYLAVRLAERPRLDLALLLGFAMGAGVLTKETGRFAVAMAPLALVLFDWRSGGVRLRLARWLGLFAVALLVALACFSVLVLSPQWPLYSGGAGDGLHHSIGDALGRPGFWLGHNGSQLWPALEGYIGVPLMLCLPLGFLAARPAQRRLVGLIAAWGLLPFLAALLLANNGYPRYWLNAIAPLTIPTALGLVAAVGWVRARSRRHPLGRLMPGLAAVALVAIPAILTARSLASPSTTHYPGPDDSQYRTDWPAGTAWPALARALERRAPTGPLVVGTDRGRPLNWLLRGRNLRQVPIGTPFTSQAQFLVRDYDDTRTPAERREFVEVGRWERPGGRSAVVLYARR